MRRITEKVTRLYYWLIIFNEGQGIKAKLILFPSAILRVIYYGIDLLKIPVIRPYLLKLVLMVSPEVVVRNSNGLFRCRKGGTDIQMVAEVWDPELTEWFNSTNVGVFIDVGANIGRYTVKVGKQAGSRVIAIEPDPDNFNALKANIELNRLNNVTALNIACWNKEAELLLSLASTQNKAISSVKEIVSSRHTKVKGMRLDTILEELGIEHVDLIKIDTEGAEEEVLQGASNTIKNNRDIQVLFEAWDKEHLNRCKQTLELLGLIVAEGTFDSLNYLASRQHSPHLACSSNSHQQTLRNQQCI